MIIRRAECLVRIKVIVKPNAKKPKIVENDDHLHVWVDAPARKNKANRRLIELLSRYYGVSKSNIRIIKGITSTIKLIEIEK